MAYNQLLPVGTVAMLRVAGGANCGTELEKLLSVGTCSGRDSESPARARARAHTHARAHTRLRSLRLALSGGSSQSCSP